MPIAIKRIAEFDREFKRLLKRYRSLEEDFKIFIDTQIKLKHELNIDNGGIVRISGLGIDGPQLYKVRRFACKTLCGTGGNSGIRIVYAYYEQDHFLEFVEIYYKGDKENEDRRRIIRHYKK